MNKKRSGSSVFGALIIFALAPAALAETVVCGDSATIPVQDADLNRTIGQAEKFEVVKLFQGFTKDSSVKMKGETEFVKVQFESNKDEDLKIGWIAATQVKPKSECAGARAQEVAPSIAPTALGKNIVGLSDSACCLFPLKHRPSASYTSGMRRFGAGRSGGRRVHAAADLYQTKNAPIIAVASGKAISGLYFFYQGTYALEVKHAGGFVVRYGELTGRQARGVRSGSTLSAGQEIGYMGKVNSGCCTPMLHFEMYKGTQAGSLTTGGRGFQRRGDLINPTSYLLKWEEKAL